MENNILSPLLQPVAVELFQDKIIDFSPITGSGSAREYYRCFLSKGNTFILCINKNIRENHTFINLDQYFLTHGLNVPRVYWHSPRYEMYILSDLGNLSLFDCIKDSQTGKFQVSDLDTLISRTFKELVELQRLPEIQWRNIVEFNPFDENLIRFDFNYCLENFFLPSNINFSDTFLKKDLDSLCHRLLSFPGELWSLMYRDFQSRNVMIANSNLSPEPFFIDFQSARKGPCIYDLVSFLWQSKAGFTDDYRRKQITVYLHFLEKHISFSKKSFLTEIPHWAIFRLIQVLGAYGLRGLKEGKSHFIESIPGAIFNLDSILNNWGLSSCYPQLYTICQQLKTIYL